MFKDEQKDMQCFILVLKHIFTAPTVSNLRYNKIHRQRKCIVNNIDSKHFTEHYISW